MTPRKIVTSNTCPPIPWRNFDWCAYRDGDEDNEFAPRGWGATEQDAIDDLMDMEEDYYAEFDATADRF